MLNPIGDMLVAAREAAGLTAVDIAKSTRIPKASILALEDGRFDALPAPVFVRGFLRAYCREVDLGAEDVLAQYDAWLHENDVRAEGEVESTLGPLVLVAGNDLPSAPSHRGLQISHVLLLLLALATFIIAYVTTGLPSKDQAPQNDRASTTRVSPDSLERPATPPSNNPTARR